MSSACSVWTSEPVFVDGITHNGVGTCTAHANKNSDCISLHQSSPCSHPDTWPMQPVLVPRRDIPLDDHGCPWMLHAGISQVNLLLVFDEPQSSTTFIFVWKIRAMMEKWSPLSSNSGLNSSRSSWKFSKIASFLFSFRMIWTTGSPINSWKTSESTVPHPVLNFDISWSLD